MEEIWKDIKDFEGLYQVSNLGRVRSLDRYVVYNNRYGTKTKILIRGKLLILSKDRNGYIHIMLHKNNKYKIYRIHQLVAQAFIPNPENKPTVNHKNRN